MLLSTKYNYAFLSNPKCASSAVFHMLAPHSEILLTYNPKFGHTNLQDFNSYCRPFIKRRIGLDEIETICIIREPLSWLDSWYRFGSRFELTDQTKSDEEGNTFGMSFEDFLKAYMSDPPPPFADVGCQYDFVVDKTNGTRIDTIFLYEHIEDFVTYMRNKTGLNLTMQYKNVSPFSVSRTKFGARLNQIYKKLHIVLARGRRIPDPASRYKVSESVLREIREFIANDFSLYHSVFEHYRAFPGQRE